MKAFDTSKSVISPEDLLDGVDFIGDFSSALKKYPNRLTGTENETACAREIRDRLHEETGARTRLEAYKAYPLLGRGCFIFLGFWYLLSLFLYYVSFAGGVTAGILLTLLALVVFITGAAVIISLFLGRRTFRGILTSRVSYNVVSERNAKCVERGKERVFVIADNHDAVEGSFFKDFNLLRKITMIIAPLSAVLFVLFCIIKMAIGTDTPAKITLLSVFPAIFGVLGILSLVTHFSPFEQHARQNNGIATSIAMATYAYFYENAEMMPDDVKLVYVSLGGENSGHGGSEAFVRAHPEFADAKVLALGDIKSDNVQIAEYDALRKIEFSTPLVSMARSAAHEQDIDLEAVAHDSFKHKFNSLHGYISNAFAKNKTESATLLAKDYGSRESALDRNDVERLLSLVVGAMEKFMYEPDAKAEDVRISSALSAEMEIMSVKKK